MNTFERSSNACLANLFPDVPGAILTETVLTEIRSRRSELPPEPTAEEWGLHERVIGDLRRDADDGVTRIADPNGASQCRNRRESMTSSLTTLSRQPSAKQRRRSNDEQPNAGGRLIHFFIAPSTDGPLYSSAFGQSNQRERNHQCHPGGQTTREFAVATPW